MLSVNSVIHVLATTLVYFKLTSKNKKILFILLSCNKTGRIKHVEVGCLYSEVRWKNGFGGNLEPPLCRYIQHIWTKVVIVSRGSSEPNREGVRDGPYSHTFIQSTTINLFNIHTKNYQLNLKYPYTM